jgi:ATP-binding cassette subfamily B protein
VLQNGSLVEHGSHDELINRRGVYADLYAAQAHAYR